MLEKTCCICEEEVKSPYSYMQHLENGKLRIFTGHKRCLGLVPDRLAKGETLRYEEIDKPKMKMKNHRYSNSKKKEGEKNGKLFD